MDEVKKENFDSSILANITHGENKKNMTEKVRRNPWIVSSLILGAIIVIFIAGNVFGLTGFSFTGKVVSGNTAGTNLVAYLNTIASSNVTLVDVKDANGMYLVNVLYNGNTIPVYMTKDGAYYTTTLVPLTANTGTQTTQTQAAIPKTDKPKVELYVFAYCPYGLQMEKAMIPVVKLLGTKIDFAIRQIGAMHDPQGCSGSACFEKTEAQRQLCIEKNYPDKYLDYVLAFADDTSCSTGDVACVLTKTTSIYKTLGIDSSKINSCMTSEGQSLYDAEVSNANSKQVSGSPTLFINGVESQVSRSPEAVLTGVCSAFNTAPTECSQQLDTNQAAAGFGTGASSGTSGTQCATA